MVTYCKAGKLKANTYFVDVFSAIEMFAKTVLFVFIKEGKLKLVWVGGYNSKGHPLLISACQVTRKNGHDSCLGSFF